LARKNIVFDGYFCEEQRQYIRKKIYSNKFEDKDYLIKPISLTAKKSENLFQDVQCYKISRKFRLLRDMFEEAFTMEEQFEEELF
jgi:hypothetical protein